MDKSCHSSSGESTNPTTSSTDQYLKHLNKLSHKITKPIIKKPPTFDNHDQPSLQNQNQNQNQNQSQPLNLQQHQQHQPPVYNINKSDFRDVVQKLTGSPAHDRSFSTPPPIQPPKPTSSRLQRIRPPPLPQLTIRSPPAAQPPTNPSTAAQPFSPLPPFPAVHAAAESPISAYMRYLHGSSSNADSDSKRFSGFSPLQSTAPLHFPMPSSPVPFGCLPSPRSPYPSLFSPTQFPLSPTVPSPRWKGV